MKNLGKSCDWLWMFPPDYRQTHAHTHTHTYTHKTNTTPPPSKTCTQREKISLAVKDDLNFHYALRLLYIFKSIFRQNLEPLEYHVIAKHKFSFTGTILQNDTRRIRESISSGNIQSQTTTIFPTEQWSIKVWISRACCQRTPPKLLVLNFPLNLVLLVL